MDKTKILVVDDESRMRKLVKDFSCEAGIYRVRGRRRHGGNGLFL